MIKNPPGPGTVVGANVKLQGILKDTNDIIIHGQLEGEVGSDQKVVVAENSVVKGPVSGDIVSIAGTVKGAVEAKTKLEILSTGRVQGSVTTKELIIQAGALFNGKSTMSDDKEDKHLKPAHQEKEARSPDESLVVEQPVGRGFWRDLKEPHKDGKIEHDLEYELE